MSDGNLQRLGEAVAPFAEPDQDLVLLFSSTTGVATVRDALERIAAPELKVRMVGAEDGLVGGFDGVDGFIEAWKDFLQVFESFENELERFLENDDKVLVLTRQRGSTRTSGVTIENEAAAVFSFEGEKLARVEFHLDRDAAFRSAGIDPGAV